METKAIYTFGPFRFERNARILLRDGKIISLTPKVAELLLVLVERNGQVVTKDELIQAVWPDTFVEESNLTSNISIVRKQLGVHPDGGEYIETIPKRGYRFVAAVGAVQDGEPAQALPELEAKPDRNEKRATPFRWILAWGAGVAVLLAMWYWHGKLPGFGGAPHVDSLAVLPLVNLSGDPAQEFFADGMTEALTADLAQIGALRVISRATVMQYKGTKKPLPEIAQQLKTDVIVLGSVFRSGRRVRVTAELVQASTDRHLWAETYERDLGDILDLQNEVARAIADEIQAKLTPHEQVRLARRRMVNADAYEAYLKGRFFVNQFTEEALEKSKDYFQEAIHLDSRYGPAYAGLAEAWAMLQYIGAATPEEARPNALEAVSKALEMDDELEEAHGAMGVIKADEWDYAGGEQECRKAFELNPGYALAHVFYSNQLRHQGRTEDSIAEAKRGLELDPLSPMTNEGLADAYLSARQYDLAVKQYQKTLELYPNQASSRDSLGWAYVYQGLYEKGIQEIQKSYGEDPSVSPELAYVYAVKGDSRKARGILERLHSISRKVPVAAHHFALIYLGLGEKDNALAWLEKARQQRSPMMAWLKVDPRFDNVRPDPRFRDMMRKVGLL
jgi:TolB-like protein/DNA-binding winged helix-turn-helix (wHTH) protein/Tfp pilus assembly protein PilF